MRVKHPVRSTFNLLFRHAMVEAQLIVTRRCNLSCGYCTEFDKTSECIPLDTLKPRVDALHRLNAINITLLGGEPLLHPDLPAIIAYADRAAQVSLTTNGFLLTGDLIGRLNDAGLANMEVSVDGLSADRTGYIQKCLKTVRSKLELLRQFARFDVHVNLVLCEQTKGEFTDAIRELNALGFSVSLGLLHDASGSVSIAGADYLALWRDYYAHARPFSYIDEEYGAQLLSGKQPQWKCRAGSRFVYVDEFGNAQFCSAQRGRLNKPITEYASHDVSQHGKTHKGCEAGCSLLCHYRDSAVDNRPFHAAAAMIKLATRGSLRGGGVA
jgi:molybdenum cofactor biosynthesis enzyme MoaA